MPIVIICKDDGKWLDLPGLNQCDRLKQFVQGAETARQDDERNGVLDKHDLPNKEVLEIDQAGQVSVGFLLMRKLDVEADRHATRFIGTLVCRLHRARAPAGDDGVPVLNQQATDLFSHRVGGIIPPDMRRSEDRHCRRNCGKRLQPVDKLRDDTENHSNIVSRQAVKGKWEFHAASVSSFAIHRPLNTGNWLYYITS